MLLKRLADLTLGDIEALRANRVLEGMSIEFKSEAVGQRDGEKREFLADVSAFANAGGGDIVIGVKTKDGAADDVCGIELEDVDKEKLRLGDVIRYGLEPRLSGVDMRWLPMGEKRGILVIRVPRSWIAPHRVIFLKDMNFYVRNTAGKSPMGVDELRQAFVHGETIAERVRAFRKDRVHALIADEAPIPLEQGAKAAFHIVPLEAFASARQVVFDPFAMNLLVPMRPFTSSDWKSSGFFCLEGSGNYAATASRDATPDAYTLAFRNGVIEAVANASWHMTPESYVDIGLIEDEILKIRRPYFDALKRAEVEPLFFVFLSLIGVKDHRPSGRNGVFGSGRAPRKDVLLLPELLVNPDNIGDPAAVLFKPMFHALANAFGLAHS